MTKEIKLTQGQVALVDDDDFAWLSQWKWHLYSNGGNNLYARTWDGVGANRKLITMHRLILRAKDGECGDHRNGNGLDNCRCNLRICTNAQNMANRGKTASNKSGYKGVNFHKARRKWRAYINANSKHYHLGLFDTPREAALAYNSACPQYHGEFACLNNIRESMP